MSDWEGLAQVSLFPVKVRSLRPGEAEWPVREATVSQWPRVDEIVHSKTPVLFNLPSGVRMMAFLDGVLRCLLRMALAVPLLS